MTNVPKPELDRGAYIVYTDEPGEVLSPGSTGGGGNAVFIINVDPDHRTYSPTFTYNEVKEAVISGKLPFTKAVFSEPTGATSYEISPIFNLVDNASDNFSITDYNNTYVATDPDVLMQHGD